MRPLKVQRCAVLSSLLWSSTAVSGITANSQPQSPPRARVARGFRREAWRSSDACLRELEGIDCRFIRNHESRRMASLGECAPFRPRSRRDPCALRSAAGHLYRRSVAPLSPACGTSRWKTLELETLGSIAISPLNGAAIPEPVDADPAKRVAALIYTSGTTGTPKGVMLTHRNLLFMAAGSMAVRTVTADDRIYGILPMSHAVGLSVVLLGSLLAGATLYVSSSFDPMSARVLLEKERLTLLFGTPAIFNQWLQYAKLQKFPH